MKNGKIAPPGYVLPNRPQWQGGWNIRSVFGAAVAFTMAASAATEWLAIQLNNPVEMGDSHPVGTRHGSLPALCGPRTLEALRWQPPYQFSRPQRPLDCIWGDHRGRALSGVFHLLVSLPHPRPQEHRQPDEPAWLRDLGDARRHREDRLA